MAFLKWSFRSKLTWTTTAMVAGAVTLSSFAALYVYRRDRILYLLERERANTINAAAHLQNGIVLANFIASERVSSSKEIILLFDDPCSSSAKVGTSSLFERQFSQGDLLATAWLETSSFKEFCQKASVASLPVSDTLQLMSDGPPLMVPYIGVINQTPSGTRASLLSMDGFETSAANTLFILDTRGEILWAADGRPYLTEALADLNVSAEALRSQISAKLSKPVPDAVDIGDGGVLSFAPVNDSWFLGSLTYRPSLMASVDFAIIQAGYLAAAFFCLALFVSRRVAYLVVQPLLELAESSKRIGQGDFTSPFLNPGDDEIGLVKSAFNLMVGKVRELLSLASEQAKLKSEIAVADQVNRLLIPAGTIKGDGIRIRGKYRSATQCGGDWWNHLELKRAEGDTLHVVLVGDVEGHGIPAALVTAAIQGSFRAFAIQAQGDPKIAEDPRKILRHFNTTLHDTTQGTVGVTFFVAIFDARAKTLTCANAGHCLPYIVGGEKIKAVSAAGLHLGIYPNETFERVDSYPWVEGLKLVIYTDGLIDAVRDGESLFDRKKLVKFLGKQGRGNAEGLVTRIFEERDRAAPNLPQEDDITVVVCEPFGPTWANVPPAAAQGVVS